MRGHVRRRGGTWAVVVDVGRDPQTRRRRQKWHSGCRTKREAENALGKILADIASGTYVEPTQQTLTEYADEWLEAQRPRLRASTWESYRDVLKAHVLPALGHVPLRALTASQIDALYARLLEHGRRDGSGGLRPRTVRYIHTVLRRALSDAVRKGLLSRSHRCDVASIGERDEAANDADLERR